MTDIPQPVGDLLDPEMTQELFATVTRGDATYYIIDQYDDVAGEPVYV